MLGRASWLLLLLTWFPTAAGLALAQPPEESQPEPNRKQAVLPATKEAAPEDKRPAEAQAQRVAALIDQLGDRSFTKRIEATEALKKIGPPAKAAVRAAAESDDPEVRVRAGIVLRALRLQELRGGEVGNRELHIVGAYEGNYPDGLRHGGGKHPRGSAEVRIDRPGRAVTLVLCAYEPIEWTIRPTEGTFVQQIILSGHFPQTLAKRPDGLKVRSFSTRRGDRDAFFAYKDQGPRNRAARKRATALTGLPVASFQGTYALTDPITIDKAPDPGNKGTQIKDDSNDQDP